jgi:hypothetical protein
MDYKDCKRVFSIKRKVVTSESQPLIEPASIQAEMVQPGRSYTSITRIENSQETGKYGTSQLGSTSGKRHVGNPAYNEGVYGKTGRSV